MRIEEFRPHFQTHLDAFLARKSRAYQTLLDDAFLHQLLDYPALLSNAGGKRIRPYVAHLMFRSASQNRENCAQNEAANRVLVALELFHLFCLVHDDIIDKGTQRYGLPTIHHFAAEQMRLDGRRGQHAHIGEAHAILIGDLLFSWSHEALNDALCDGDFAPQIRERARRAFQTMIDEVVVGQMLDVDLMTRRDASRVAIERKIALKTASYTFVRPMQIGAILADGNCDDFCEKLGISLGVAFQVQDDLLDLVGTPRTTQKTLFADLRDGTHTLFTQHVLESGNERDINDLRALMGANLTSDDRDRVLDLFTRSGALDAGREIVQQNLKNARELLHNGVLQEAERDSFCELIALLEARDSK